MVKRIINEKDKEKSSLLFFSFFLVIFLSFLGVVVYRFTREEQIGIQADMTVEWGSSVLVCDSSCEKEMHDYQIITDGDGGAIISWFDPEGITGEPPPESMKRSIFRKVEAGIDDGGIFLERVSSSGEILWGEDYDGVNIHNSEDDYYSVSIVEDSLGGAVIVYTACTTIEEEECDMHVYSIDDEGTEQEWHSITSEFDVSYAPAVVTDTADGAIVVWSYDGQILARREDVEAMLPWGFEGVDVSGSSEGENPVAISDSSGGAIIMWVNVGFGQNDVYAQKLDSDGDKQWGDNGVLICDAAGSRADWYKSIVSDGAGGAYFIWEDQRSGSYDVYAQRINSSGSVQWTEDGLAVCSENRNQHYIYSDSDGLGGVVIAWSDDRNGEGENYNYDIYAQRLNSSGDAQWTSGGKMISNAINDQILNSIVADNLGQYVLSWIDCRDSGEELCDVYAQMIDGSGETESEEDVQIYDGSASQTGMARGDDGEITISWIDGDFSLYSQQISYEDTGSGSENGEVCTDNDECESGFCTDGYCCESECSGICRSCDQSGHLGHCYLHADNTDPDDECSESVNLCNSLCIRGGGDGNCDGAGSCDIDDLTSNVDSGYICIGSGTQTAVSAINYCNYEEDCDSGDCSATEWYTSCDGAGTCRLGSDHTDAYSEGVTVSVNKVLAADCSETDAVSGTSCDGSVDYYGTAGGCTYSRRYAECDGVGNCDNDASDNYEGSSQDVPDGNVAVTQSGGSGLPYENPSSSNNCEYVEDCDSGDCSATKWYRACDGSGICSSDNTGADSEVVYALVGYTLTDDCEIDGDENCLFVGLECTSNCQMRGTGYTCGEANECDYDSGIGFENCEAGTSCEEGECLADYYCNSEKESLGEGDNNYNVAGDYYCKGGCDGDNNCDYAVDCRLISDESIVEDEDNDDDENNGYDELPQTGDEDDTEPLLRVLSEQVVKTVAGIRENEIIVKTTETVGVPLVMAPLFFEFIEITFPILSTFAIGPANFFLSLVYLIFREKKNHWGIIYSKVKKNPIPFAVIHVKKDNEKNIIITKVSDIQGRYSLILDKGKYQISVKHSDYKEYKDEFTINSKNKISIETDIGLYPKDISFLHRLFINLKEYIDILFKNYGYIILTIGFWLAVLVWLIVPSVLNLMILSLYIPFILLYHRARTQYPKNWSKVLESSTGKAVQGAFVKIYKKVDKDLVLIDSAITDSDGKYGFILVKGGDYYILVSATGYKFPSKKIKYPTEFYGSLIKVNIGKQKILKDNLFVDYTGVKDKTGSSPFK